MIFSLRLNSRCVTWMVFILAPSTLALKCDFKFYYEIKCVSRFPMVATSIQLANRVHRDTERINIKLFYSLWYYWLLVLPLLAELKQNGHPLFVTNFRTSITFLNSDSFAKENMNSLLWRGPTIFSMNVCHVCFQKCAIDDYSDSQCLRFSTWTNSWSSNVH